MSKIEFNLERRKFLMLSAAAGATGLAGMAGLIGARSASAQSQWPGLPDGVGTTPFHAPAGAMDHLDRTQYIHNMEILAHVEGQSTAGGEPLMAMWARGAQRLLPVGRAGWLDVSDPRKPTVVPVNGGVSGCIAYNTRIKKWLMVKSASQPNSTPMPGEFPHGHYDEEYRKKVMSYKGLRASASTTSPTPPRPSCSTSSRPERWAPAPT